jgi:hypothetical protein
MYVLVSVGISCLTVYLRRVFSSVEHELIINWLSFPQVEIHSISTNGQTFDISTN